MKIRNLLAGTATFCLFASAVWAGKDLLIKAKDKKGNPSKSIEEEYGTRYPDIFGDLKLREVLGYLKTSTAPAVGGYRKKQRKTRRSKKSRNATRSRKYRVNRI